jgi:ElaB/YqjD/DUF883 family membrane-anchored ribosome-binding protein
MDKSSPNRDRETDNGTDTVSDRLPEMVNFPPSVLVRHRARVLDPSTAVRTAGTTRPEPTAYRADTLLIPLRQALDPETIARYNKALDALGVELDVVLPKSERWREAVKTFKQDVAIPVLMRLKDDTVTDHAPDPWAALVALRRTIGLDELGGVGLEHLTMAATVEIDGAPAGQGPSVSEGGERITMSTGDRNPVRVFLPRPERAAPASLPAGRRPVVSVLDTGIGMHPWLGVGKLADDPVVEVSDEFQTLVSELEAALAQQSGDAVASLVSPEEQSDAIQPLLGLIDSHSGHGTFVSGLVLQNCPDVRILSLRVLHTDGICTDVSVLLGLEWLRRRVQKAIDEKKPELLVDVVSLSLGFYPERTDHATSQLLAEAVRRLTDLGVVVVAAAGNDATTRPFVPAALALNADGSNGGNPLLVAVGALNASGASIAAFSNEGDWVRRWAPGNAVVSTVPLWQGSRQPDLEVPDGAMERTGPDEDDLTTGFAVWAGTSFATPVVAGMLATEFAGLADSLDPAARKKRAEKVLKATDDKLAKNPWRNGISTS